MIRSRQEFLSRLQELKEIGFTPGRQNGQRTPLDSKVKSLLVWYYGKACTAKSPLQVPSMAIKHFRLNYLALTKPRKEVMHLN